MMKILVLLIAVFMLTLVTPLFLIGILLFIESCSAVLSKSTSKLSTFRKETATVLVPAHNEERVIKVTLESLIPTLGDQDRLIVIADHCTDATVAIASQMGAFVLERNNSQLRGKGYALDYGLQFLSLVVQKTLFPRSAVSS
jgi:cellulose synthase/poly-beta-1,6-N-acetylglucosamine synthase-like glycosyltransferase